MVHCEFRVSQRFVLGLSSHFDDGNKILGRASQLDRKPSHRVLVGLGLFFYPQMEKPWHGAGYSEDLVFLKKLKWSGSNRWAEK